MANTVLQLHVRTLADGKTVAVLVAGMASDAFKDLGARLSSVVATNGEQLEESNLSGAQVPGEFIGFDAAWVLRGGDPERLVQAIGEMLGFSLPKPTS